MYLQFYQMQEKDTDGSVKSRLLMLHTQKFVQNTKHADCLIQKRQLVGQRPALPDLQCTQTVFAAEALSACTAHQALALDVSGPFMSRQGFLHVSVGIVLAPAAGWISLEKPRARPSTHSSD